jgi:hypothetical protein
MASNSALVVSDLDFDTIRSNLSEYLKSQSRFKDYDFDGSNLSVLLDVLSYNTFMNNFYTNMAISESFLDSAQIRDSVVSRAKELNYLPRSYTSAKAYVDIAIEANDSPAIITIPKGTPFNSRIDNSVYTFTTDSDIVVSAADEYTAANVAIYEGVYVTESIVVNTDIENQKFVISNVNVDTSSITVVVQASLTDTTNSEYQSATSLLGYSAVSKIFFIQPATKDRYEVVFGDNSVGVKPINGNVIYITYRIAKGSAANKSRDFMASGTVSGYNSSDITVTTNLEAFGGNELETIQSIKYKAPRHYQTQERAVTTSDYKTILFEKYSDIRAINVYGGEQVIPPQYGKVYVCIDFSNFDGIPASLKTDIESFLTLKMPISISPVITSADYTYIGVTADILYDLGLTSKSPNDIKNLIYSAIQDYNDTSLDEFNITFRYSKLAAACDGADSSIVSSNITVQMIKDISPELDTATSYSLDFQNAIIAGTLESSTFTYNNVLCYFKDDSDGSIHLKTVDTGTEVTVTNDLGNVNYSTGVLSLNAPAISDYSGSAIKLYAKSSTNDFSGSKNTILSIRAEDIIPTVTAVRT